MSEENIVNAVYGYDMRPKYIAAEEVGSLYYHRVLLTKVCLMCEGRGFHRTPVAKNPLHGYASEHCVWCEGTGREVPKVEQRTGEETV